MLRRLAMAAVISVLGVSCADYLLEPHSDGGMNPGDGGSFLDGGNDAGVFDDAGTDAGAFDAGMIVPDAGFAVCKDQGRRLDLSPLDLLVVLDVSYSMDYDEKWTAVKSAMKSFVGRPDFTGLGVGVQYFPLRNQCSVEDYAAPAVAIGVLPGVGGSISSSLDQQQMSGGTPTVPALEGAVTYSKLWLGQHPERQTVIVLATDGVPDGTCAGAATSGLTNSLANVLIVAKGAATSSPPVKTFVIGVGKDLGALNDIAVAGGSKAALFVDSTANADVAFLAALSSIRRSALGCDFPVPAGTIQGLAQVNFVPDDGKPTLFFPQVADKTACGAGGWYFDDPVEQTKVVLCDRTCDQITVATTGQIHVEFACGIN